MNQLKDNFFFYLFISSHMIRIIICFLTLNENLPISRKITMTNARKSTGRVHTSSVVETSVIARLSTRFDSSEFVPTLSGFIAIVQILVIKVQIGIEVARRPEVIRAIGRITRTIVYIVQFQVVQRVNSSHQIALAILA